MYDRLVSETADLWFGGRIDAFFSVPEIPFPGNGDRSRQRLGSNGELLRRKPEHLVLAGPFGRQVGEADYSHAMRKPRAGQAVDLVDHDHVDLADAHVIEEPLQSWPVGVAARETPVLVFGSQEAPSGVRLAANIGL